MTVNEIQKYVTNIQKQYQEIIEKSGINQQMEEIQRIVDESGINKQNEEIKRIYEESGIPEALNKFKEATEGNYKALENFKLAIKF